MSVRGAENTLSVDSKAAAAFRKVAKRNTYGDFGDRLGVGCLGIVEVEGSILDDCDCDIFLRNFSFINSVVSKRWFCPTYKILYTLRVIDISTMNRLRTDSLKMMDVGCLSERAENTLSVASIVLKNMFHYCTV